MAGKSSIEWTGETWNPVTGCDAISPGCDHCYAELMAKRLKAMGQKQYRNGFEVTLAPQALDAPRRWRKPRLVFVNSMSDLFHEKIDLDYIQKVFEVMRETPRHHYQVLTKRSTRLKALSSQIDWPDNVWMGVTVETNPYLRRVDRLRETGAKVKFLSLEPLLGPLPDLDLEGIDWAIVGGESGKGARPMNEEWVWEILHLCREKGVPFFFKQWGTRDGVKNKKLAGRLLGGETYDEMPAIYRKDGYESE